MRRARGTIYVFTFKEGVFSAVAHDLRLRLERFDITLKHEDVEAELDLQSLVVCGPVRAGVVQTDELDASDRARIERAMRDDVLHSAKHPFARFVGRASIDAKIDGYAVSGQLDLAGRSAPLSFAVKNDGGVYHAEIELRPTRWGVGQYSALLGAIRLKDRVRIELALTEV